MATDAEEAVIGLSRCLTRALTEYGVCPAPVRQLVRDLRFQITELELERCSMNRGTWRHKEDMEPTKIKEPVSNVVEIADSTETLATPDKGLIEIVTPVSADVLATAESAPVAVAESYLHSIAITPRERQVARLLISGLATVTIAALLGLAEKTIKHHIARLYTIANVGSRTEFCAAVFGYTTEVAHRLNDSDPAPQAEKYSHLRKNVPVELGI